MILTKDNVEFIGKRLDELQSQCKIMFDALNQIAAFGDNAYSPSRIAKKAIESVNKFEESQIIERYEGQHFTISLQGNYNDSK
jgi:hypothetical protein